MIALIGIGLVATRLTFVDDAHAKQMAALVQKAAASTQMGVTGRILVANDGAKTVMVRMIFRHADDFSILDASNPVTVLPRPSAFFDVIFDIAGECQVRVAVFVVDATCGVRFPE